MRKKLLVERELEIFNEININYWMKHPGYEVLAGEPREVTYEIIRRLLAEKPRPDEPKKKQRKQDDE